MSAFANRVRQSLTSRWGLWRTRKLRRDLALVMAEIERRGMVLISNNCVAGMMYEIAGLAKQSPTAGLYFTKSAYPRFLDDIARGRIDEWTAFDPDQLVFRPSQSCWELQARDGEVVFLHYASPEEAVAKWRRRIERMGDRTPIVISSVQNGTSCASIEHATRALPYALVVDGDPAPPADKIMLSPAFLRTARDFLSGVLDHSTSHVRVLHRGRDFLVQDSHPHS